MTDLFADSTPVPAFPPERYTPDSAPPVRPKPARPCTYEQMVREKFGLPASWWAYALQSVPMGAYQGVQIEGGVFSTMIEKGPRKGRPDLKRPDPGTALTWSFSQPDWEAWKREWEEAEGLCHECEGTGIVFGRWSKEHGTTMRPCRRCDGTGDPPAARGQGAA